MLQYKRILSVITVLVLMLQILSVSAAADDAIGAEAPAAIVSGTSVGAPYENMPEDEGDAERLSETTDGATHWYVPEDEDGAAILYELTDDAPCEDIPEDEDVAEAIDQKSAPAAVGAGVTYILDGTVLTITGSGSMSPMMDEDRSYPWADAASTVQTIIIQDGVTDISRNAFRDFTALTSVSIPDSVTEIGILAFYNCQNLEQVSLPESVKQLDLAAFANCVSLTSVIMGGVEDIDESAFKGCQSLEQISLPESVKRIGESAFADCVKLVSVNMDSVEEIGDNAFQATAIEEVSFGSLTSLGNYAFLYANHLRSVSIPDGITEIGIATFGHCQNLEQVSLPESVKKLGDGAFYNCVSLTSVVMDGVEEIGDSAFESTAIEEVSFGSLISLGNYAFRYAKKLRSVSISGSITEIGEGTFFDCHDLEQVSLPESVEKLGKGAFADCVSLVSVNVDSVGEIDDYAFQATAIKEISFGAGLSKLSYSAFFGASPVAFSVPDNNPTFCSVDGVLYSKSMDTLILYPAGNPDEEFTVPASVQTIGVNAFVYNYSLVSIDLGSVTTLERIAFQNACSLRSVSIPDGVTEISHGAFYDCQNLEQVSLSESVKKLGGFAFFDCVKLVSVNIDSVEEIGESAFESTAIKEVSFGALKSIGNSAFAECQKLTEVILPDSVTQAGDYAFYNCKMLRSVKFGTGLESTSYMMFYNCGLEEIDFGNLKSIGDSSFIWCTFLYEVTLPDTVTEIEIEAFKHCTMLEKFSAPSVTDIQFGAFMYTGLRELDLPKIETIQSAAFYNSALLSVKLPESTQFVSSTAFTRIAVLDCANKKLKKYGDNGLRLLDEMTFTGVNHYQKAFEVLELVNAERAKQGLDPLVMDESLLETAMLRAAENAVLCSHVRPDGSRYTTANNRVSAENIAIGQGDAADVMALWMDTSEARNTILNKYRSAIGVGCFEHNGVTTWVQCFGSGSNDNIVTDPQPAKLVSPTISLAVGEFQGDIDYNGVPGANLSTYSYSAEVHVADTEPSAGKTLPAEMRIHNPVVPNISVTPDNVGINWSSSNPNAVSVDTRGRYTGIGGSARITARLEYLTATSDEIFVQGGVAPVVLGDVDENGIVEIIDATYIQRKLADMPTDVMIEEAADVDGDGTIGIADATLIQRWQAGLLSNDNIGKPIS